MDNHEKYLDNELFQRWIATDDAEINEYWENRMRENPDIADEIRESHAFFNSVKFKTHEPDNNKVKSSWKAVDRSTSAKSNYWKGFLKYAAMTAFFIMTFLAVRYFVESGDSDTRQQLVRSVLKQAEKGVKLTVQLSDGTKIKLNSGSKLMYPEVFADDMRVVELIGEGFFEVAHDEQRPFIVKTGRIETRVLGTKFSVRAFENKKLQVALVSGSVRVESEEHIDGQAACNTTVLEPGYKAIYDSNCFVKSEINPPFDLGWKDDIIAFRNNNISEIIETLENWYGVSFTVEREHVIARSFNGVYERENLENVLKSVAYAMNFTYKIEGNKVTIKGK
jgi:ferric-dicitrate binding protein FerR (iron transport regulator)